MRYPAIARSGFCNQALMLVLFFVLSGPTPGNAYQYTWNGSLSEAEGTMSNVVLERNPLLSRDYQYSSLVLASNPSVTLSDYQSSTKTVVGSLAQDCMNQAFSPAIFLLSSGYYRIYYTRGYKAEWDTKEGYRYLVYQDSSNGLSTGAYWESTSLGIGTVGAWAQRPFIMKVDNTYRLYFAQSVSGTMRLKYRTATTLDGLNNATTTDLGTSSSDGQEEHPFVYREGSTFRVLFTKRYTSNSTVYRKIVYRNSTNGLNGWGSETNVSIALPTGNSISSPFLYKKTDGQYLLYYFLDNGQYSQLAYSYSPNFTDWSDPQMLGIGASKSASATDPFLMRLQNGDYRLYYAYGTLDNRLSGYKDNCYRIMACTIPAVHVSAGTYLSKVIDGGTMSNWKIASSSVTLPTSTSVQYTYRTGNTAAPDASWGAWETFGSSWGAQVGRYIQWQAQLQTSNSKSTPVFKTLTIENQSIFTITVTPTVTVTPTISPTPSITPTLTISPTVVPSCTVTPTVTISPTITETATVTPTFPHTPIPEGEKRLRVWHSQINPARGEKARIRWYQAEESPVRIRIYNQLGREVITLEDGGDYAPAIIHEITWDGTNRQGTTVGSGIYIVYYTSGGRKEWNKIAVVK